MKYIIMCGGHYLYHETPRQLTVIKGEPIVARTIRLLRENGVDDIAISSDNMLFNQFGVPVLVHDNPFNVRGHNDVDGYWCDAFYPMDEPVCYLFGDVVFSPAAIRKIIETETDDIQFFGSAEPFAPGYAKKWIEPFAFKVTNNERFKESIVRMKELTPICRRSPISWDLWAVIKGRRIDIDDYKVDYVVINDYTCDVDHPKDVKRILKGMALYG